MLTGAGLGLRDGLWVPVLETPSPARLRYALPCLTLAMLDYRTKSDTITRQERIYHGLDTLLEKTRTLGLGRLRGSS
ncbi:MAG: hypothetical protein ACYSOO_01920 [Planctomycetota bacterium]